MRTGLVALTILLAMGKIIGILELSWYLVFLPVYVSLLVWLLAFAVLTFRMRQGGRSFLQRTNRS